MPERTINTGCFMKHRISADDQVFLRAFEACGISAEDFDHAAHVRLAYIFLCQLPVDEAAEAMKRSLLAFLDHLGVGASKYHETITRAWIMAVRHFMEASAECASAAEFIERNPRLLDSRIMLTHYSAEVLFSPAARSKFVEPDREPIPQHG